MSEIHKNNTNQVQIIDIFRLILRLEWVWLAIMIFAYWHRDDPFRYEWRFLLLFAIPIYSSRWIVHRRLWTKTPFDLLFIAFLLLSIYNYVAAPISRTDYIVIICRPLSGIFLVWYFSEHVRKHGHMSYIFSVSVVLGILIGLVALVASQWETGKADAFAFITSYLPQLDRQVLPDMQLSFNPNEIAGALAYLCSFLLGISFTQFNEYIDKQSTKNQVINSFLRWGALIGFAFTFSALLFGQSRFALAGVFVALLCVIVFIPRKWRYRLPLLGIWGLFLLLEILIVTNVLPLQDKPNTQEISTTDTTTSVLSSRDERTLSSRFDIWERALWMIRDYPLTGSGMSTFRAMVLREAYTIPYYEDKAFGPPHAHNEFLQLGADLGIGGLIIFFGWYLVILVMMIRILKYHKIPLNNMTIAITSGILAHMGYAVGDAITLWDRFAFLHWWFFALVAALYTLVIYHPAISSQNVTD